MIVNLIKSEALEIEGATIFIKGLPSWLNAVIGRKVSDMADVDTLTEGQSIHVGSALFRATCRYGITGWEGVKDAEDNDIQPEFENAIHGVETAKRLQMDSLFFNDSQFIEIGSRIMELSQLTPKTKKNSGVQSGRTSSSSKTDSSKGDSPAKAAKPKSKGAARSKK